MTDGNGRTHGAPYRGYRYVPLRFGGGGGDIVRRMGTQQQVTDGIGRKHDAPYRGYGYVPLRFGEGTSLGEWEHNNNSD